MSARAGRRLTGASVAAVLLAASLGAPGCYTTQMQLLKSGLDSLRTQVDVMVVRDSIAARTLDDTRRELAEQRDLLLSTRATASSTARETEETLGRLEGKLDDIMARFRIAAERGSTRPGEPAPATGGGAPAATGPAPVELYDQATTDLTQGRYALALAAYREFVQRYGQMDLADNAQYGVGECFFAQAQFDSAAVEYRRVGERWPSGERVPAAIYKMALCLERLGRRAESVSAFEDLLKRFPQSGEAQLARDRVPPKR